jgi:hypothetical protein
MTTSNKLTNALGGLVGDGARRYTDAQIQAVWNKGIIIPGYDAAVWRWDAQGNVMYRADHGDRSSPHGWEIDHFPVPASFGGSDDLSNLRPLHWRANAQHGGALTGLFGMRKNG